VLADLAILVLFSVSMLLARVVFDTGEGGGTEILPDSRGKSVGPSPLVCSSACCSHCTALHRP
jgi:hypothetical protein